MADGEFLEYKKLFISELERVSREIHLIGEKIDGASEIRNREIMEMRVEIGMLKVKAGVWGLLGGLIPALIAIAVTFRK